MNLDGYFESLPDFWKFTLKQRHFGCLYPWPVHHPQDSLGSGRVWSGCVVSVSARRWSFVAVWSCFWILESRHLRICKQFLATAVTCIIAKYILHTTIIIRNPLEGNFQTTPKPKTQNPTTVNPMEKPAIWKHLVFPGPPEQGGLWSTGPKTLQPSWKIWHSTCDSTVG